MLPARAVPSGKEALGSCTGMTMLTLTHPETHPTGTAGKGYVDSKLGRNLDPTFLSETCIRYGGTSTKVPRNVEEASPRRPSSLATAKQQKRWGSLGRDRALSRDPNTSTGISSGTRSS